jgi:hypothetical protein
MESDAKIAVCDNCIFPLVGVEKFSCTAPLFVSAVSSGVAPAEGDWHAKDLTL